MPARNGRAKGDACLERHVEIERIDRNPGDRSNGTTERSGNDANARAFGGNFGNAVRRYVLIARRRHLVASRKVHPELEAAHGTVFLLGHFRMDDPASGGHPLHAARLEKTGVSVIVAMPHAPFEHVRHGFESTMRMIGKTAGVVHRVVGTEFVEQ